MSGFRFVFTYAGDPVRYSCRASESLAEMWPRNSERRERAAHELADTGRTSNGPMLLTDTEHGTPAREPATEAALCWSLRSGYSYASQALTEYCDARRMLWRADYQNVVTFEDTRQ